MFEDLFRTKNFAKAHPIFDVLGTDIHCHLIPNVDDGSKSVQESLSCLEILKQTGFHKMYITPHFQTPRYPNTEENIESKFQDLKKAVRQSGIDSPELCGVGGEYRIDSSFRLRIENPKFLLTGGNRILVELSLHQQVMGVDQAIFDLQMKGYEVILAHPERYPYLNITSPLLSRLKDQGVFFQVNILSLTGFYGKSSKIKGYELIEEGMVEFLGTDVHNLLYAQALVDATHDRKLDKMLHNRTFLNSEL